MSTLELILNNSHLSNYKLDKRINTFVWIVLFIFFFLEVNKFFVFWEFNKALYLIFIFASVFFIYYRFKLDKILFIILVYWVVINLLASLLFPYSSNIEDLRISIITIIGAYLIAKMLGPMIFYKIEKITAILSLLSIPLFFAQIVFLNTFYSLTKYLGFINYGETTIGGGWNIIIYHFSTNSPERNCGFMWEPGAFAFILVLAQIIRFSYNGYKFDKITLVYLITVITTFSTMGYFAYSLLVYVYIIHNSKNRIFLFLLLPPFIYFIYEAYMFYDFLGGKINIYLDNLETYHFTDSIYGGILKFNRMGYFVYSMVETVKWPLGYGVHTNIGFTGVGTVSDVLLSWGILGLVFFIHSLKKVIKILFANSGIILKSSFILTLSLLSAFSSNPFASSFIAFLFVFYPFFHKN